MKAAPFSAHGWRLSSEESSGKVEPEEELVLDGPWFPSPEDWRHEVIYFLMVDRFSDGFEDSRKVYCRGEPGNVKDWKAWEESGRARYQGGTLEGLQSKLDYLKKLGVTALWISPVAKQRTRLDTYHGYSSQDFMDVEPRLTRGDPDRSPMQVLRDLVEKAHEMGIRVILDVVFNHSGCNWIYASDDPKLAEYMPDRKRGFGGWLAEDENVVNELPKDKRNDGVWPVELQRPEIYHRAGTGDLGDGDVLDPIAVNKRSDFFELRSIDHRAGDCLEDLIRIFQYWIAATDCDGFRLDTLKHMTIDTARTFCAEMKKFASENLDKANFLIIGEIAGGNYFQEIGQRSIGDALDGTLDIGEARVNLTEAALLTQEPEKYFDNLDGGNEMAMYRTLGRFVSILDDHDLVSIAPNTPRIRFAGRAERQDQVLLALAMQLFGPGIPCIYYGTEQALSGPVPASVRGELVDWGIHDHFLRETMFGAAHPRVAGKNGVCEDKTIPGFAAFGACGRHVFDEEFFLYKAIQEMLAVRAANPVFLSGTYNRSDWMNRPSKRICAFSRLLGDEEAFVVINFSMDTQPTSRLYVHHNPNNTQLEVLYNSLESLAESTPCPEFEGPCKKGAIMTLSTSDDARAFLQVPELPPLQIIAFKSFSV